MKRSQDMDRTRRPLPPRHCGAVRQQNYSTIVLLFWCTVGSVAWWLCNGCGVSGSRSRLSCGRGGRPEICIQHRGGQSVGRRSICSISVFILPRLCPPRCWMATHDPVKCELWTGLVGPCHLIIVGPSGSRTTVQWEIFCRFIQRSVL